MLLARLLGLLTPLVTVALVGVLVLGAGAPRSIQAARVWGGPTDGIPRWSGWVEAGSGEDGASPLSGLRVDVEARPLGGAPLARTVVLDAEGQAEIAFDFPGGAPGQVEIRVLQGGGELARGPLALGVQRWLERAGRRGGVLPVTSRGRVKLRAAPSRGAFAVPFASPLWIQAERGGSPAAEVRLHVSAGGAQVALADLTTDSRGVARTELQPQEHAVTLSIRAAEPGAGELTASIPVIPGALFAERRKERVWIASPVEREEAFVTFVSERGRWSSVRLPLQRNGRGGSEASLPMPKELPAESWAVVSSTRVPTAARVGWPLFDSDEPLVTLDAADVLLLDGFPAARARERQRQRRVMVWALAAGLAGAVVTVLSLLWSARRQRRWLDAHLSRQLGQTEAAQVAPPARLRTLLVTGSILLGFLLIALVTAWRLN